MLPCESEPNHGKKHIVNTVASNDDGPKLQHHCHSAGFRTAVHGGQCAFKEDKCKKKQKKLSKLFEYASFTAAAGAIMTMNHKSHIHEII